MFFPCARPPLRLVPGPARRGAGRFELVDTSQSRLVLVVINRSLVVHICMPGLADCSDNVCRAGV